MHRNLRKISITLDPSLVDDLDYLSKRLGVSRSAMISEILGEAIPPARKLLEQVPLNPTPNDVVRFRGESAEVVRARIESIKDLDSDLFSAIMNPTTPSGLVQSEKESDE